MKLFTSLPLFIVAAVAQNVAVSVPADGASVTAGSNITIEVDRPNTLSGSTEVAVVIGFTSCASFPCPAPADVMGNILYNGPYHPQLQSGAEFKPPHQNLTVTIPPSAPVGKAQLNVAHIALIGAGQAPFLQTLNVSLNVVPS